MKKTGAFAGKFLPPHIGHAYSIREAAEKCDKLYVVLAEDPKRCKELCQEASLPSLQAFLRISWLKKHLEDVKNIEFLYFDETGIPPFPNGLKEWTEKFWQIVPKNVNMKFADETYRDLNEKYFPNCTFVPFNRTIIPISSTMIRGNLAKYYTYLLPCSKPFFKEILTKKGIKDYE